MISISFRIIYIEKNIAMDIISNKKNFIYKTANKTTSPYIIIRKIDASAKRRAWKRIRWKAIFARKTACTRPSVGVRYICILLYPFLHFQQSHRTTRISHCCLFLRTSHFPVGSFCASTRKPTADDMAGDRKIEKIIEAPRKIAPRENRPSRKLPDLIFRTRAQLTAHGTQAFPTIFRLKCNVIEIFSSFRENKSVHAHFESFYVLVTRL